MSGPFHRILSAIHQLDLRLNERLDSLEGKVNRLLGMELGDARRDIAMAKNVDRLEKALEKNTSVVDATVELVNTLIQEVRDNIDDDPKVEAVLAKYEENNQRLAEAVAKGTPAQPSGM